MKLLASLVIFSTFLISTSAHSATEIEEQIKKSYLTLSAFECSAVAPNEKEAARLFMLGLESGRDFIEFARSNIETYKKELKSKVPILWNMTSGPTPDFILGQIYADRVNEVYKEYSTDQELWDINKGNMWHSKNCSLLQK